MLQFEELKQELSGLEPSIRDLEGALGLKAMQNEVAELDMKASEPNFWDDQERSQKVLQRSSMLKNKIAAYEGQVPGTTAAECGNYLEHDLAGAKKEASLFLPVIADWKTENLKYTE